MQQLPILHSVERSREYNLYEEDQREEVVFLFLFHSYSHRRLDEVVLSLDPEISKGYQSMGILHHLGIIEDHKGLFSNYTVQKAIQLIKYQGSEEYSQIGNMITRFTDRHLSLFSESNHVLSKRVGKSQYQDGIRINNDYFDVFNSLDSHNHIIRGQSRRIYLFFNGKIFPANYRYENQSDPTIHLERIGFEKNIIHEFEKVFPKRQGCFDLVMGQDDNHFIIQARSSEKAQQKALYLNGVFEVILSDILESLSSGKTSEGYLQPYKTSVIQLLKDEAPTLENPISLYVSTTTQLSEISYTAEIIGWEDKRYLSEERKQEVEESIKQFQPHESGLYLINEKDEEYVNLIKIKNLQKLKHSVPVTHLTRVSDGKPHKIRSQAGGWSPVYLLPQESDEIPYFTEEQVLRSLESDKQESQRLSQEERLERLLKAQKKPEKIHITSTGYQRNPDVIAEVLIRADGICEQCHSPAPFLRASDGTPYLEVHHIIPLSEGGDDTVENALALCPNCHREAHFG